MTVQFGLRTKKITRNEKLWRISHYFWLLWIIKCSDTFQFRSVLSYFAWSFLTWLDSFQLQTFQLKTFQFHVFFNNPFQLHVSHTDRHAEDGPNSRIADKLSPNHGPDQMELGPKSQTAAQIPTGTVIWSGPIFQRTYLREKKVSRIFLVETALLTSS